MAQQTVAAFSLQLFSLSSSLCQRNCYFPEAIVFPEKQQNNRIVKSLTLLLPPTGFCSGSRQMSQPQRFIFNRYIYGCIHIKLKYWLLARVTLCYAEQTQKNQFLRLQGYKYTRVKLQSSRKAQHSVWWCGAGAGPLTHLAGNRHGSEHGPNLIEKKKIKKCIV